VIGYRLRKEADSAVSCDLEVCHSYVCHGLGFNDKKRVFSRMINAIISVRIKAEF
jgi:hypothetical protein